MDVRMVQANLLWTLPLKEFMADLEDIAQFEPEICCLNEVDSKNVPLKKWATEHKLNLVHFFANKGSDGDVALAFSDRFEVLESGVAPLHGEPPGKPSQRFACWAIVLDKKTGEILRVIGVHTLASVQSASRLKTIPRVKYWVTGIQNIIVLDKRLRTLANKSTGKVGIGVCLGDMNWAYGKGDVLDKLLGIWYVSSFQTLGLPNRNTLGISRSVDYVWKRGRRAQWIYHFVFPLNSDHNGLFAVLNISQ